MLGELLAAAVFAAFLNIAIYVAGVKLEVWITLRVDPCFFCMAFWLCAAEYIIAGLAGFVPLYWAIPVALCSAGIAAFLNQFIDHSRS